MISNVNWNYPTSIAFGNGRIKDTGTFCKDFSISNPLIVTDQGLANFDFITELQNSLPHNTLYSRVKPNPNGKNISDGVQVYKEGNHDGVIAIGGGSALDAGKAIALMIDQKGSIWDYEDIGDNWLNVNGDLIPPIIAIPTTAGTGSEVGRASVILNEDTQEKKIIFHPKMLPSKVILDPELTMGLPAHITAATGLDAFVHSFEAFCAPGFHPMADGIALRGMYLTKKWLPEAFAKGNDLEARGNMIVASSMGATAFQKGLGGVHALAHSIGALYDTHHGLLNAILLPYILLPNRLEIRSKCFEICDAIHLDYRDSTGFDTFFNWIIDFRQRLNIPNSLKEIGLTDQDAEKIGQMAIKDPSASGNPCALTADQYTQIYINALNGKYEQWY